MRPFDRTPGATACGARFDMASTLEELAEKAIRKIGVGEVFDAPRHDRAVDLDLGALASGLLDRPLLLAGDPRGRAEHSVWMTREHRGKEIARDRLVSCAERVQPIGRKHGVAALLVEQQGRATF